MSEKDKDPSDILRRIQEVEVKVEKMILEASKQGQQRVKESEERAQHILEKKKLELEQMNAILLQEKGQDAEKEAAAIIQAAERQAQRIKSEGLKKLDQAGLLVLHHVYPDLDWKG